MSKQHTYVTKSEKKRNAAHRKRSRLIVRVGAVIAVIALLIFAVDRFISTRYQVGGKLGKDIRTAEELKDDVLNILVCGLDYEEDRSAAMTDVILYVSMDIKNKSVSAFQIPRDTYIGDDVPTGGSGKINGVYWHGRDKDSKINNLARVINQKLGLPIDHYVTLDMDAFVAMVDSIDNGLQMYVPYPIITKDDKGHEETIIPEAGWYYVSGQTAEAIVRNRNYPNADVQRLEVQSYFYAALAKYFMENLNVSDFIKILPRFTQHITTDMHWTKIASIAQFGFSVDYEDMRIIKPSLHGYDIIREGKTSAVNMLIREKDNWAELLNRYSRPGQEDMSSRQLTLPSAPPAGSTVVNDYGVTARSVQTIGDIMAKSPEE